MSKFQEEKIEIKNSVSITCTIISQSVYMPNFRAIRPFVREINGNTQTDRNTDLNFIKIDDKINIWSESKFGIGN